MKDCNVLVDPVDIKSDLEGAKVLDFVMDEVNSNDDGVKVFAVIENMELASFGRLFNWDVKKGSTLVDETPWVISAVGTTGCCEYTLELAVLMEGKSDVN